MINKKLFELHEAYGKHDYTVINDLAGCCACGYYEYRPTGGPVIKYAESIVRLHPEHKQPLIYHLLNLMRYPHLAKDNCMTSNVKHIRAHIRRTIKEVRNV